jgi:O-antigen ligase
MAPSVGTAVTRPGVRDWAWAGDAEREASRGRGRSRLARRSGECAIAALATLIGWAISGAHASLVVAGVLGVVFLVGLVSAFRRDAAGTLLAFWVLQLVLVPVSALAGYTTPLGAAIRQGTDVITGALVIMVIWSLVTHRASLGPLRYVIAGIGVGVCGLASSLVAHGGIAVTAEGAWLGLKMWTLIAIALCIRWRAADAVRICSVFRRTGICIALLGLADYVTHGGVAATLHTNVITNGVATYRSNSISAIFATPGEYSLCMSLLFGIALASYATLRQRRDLAAALLFAVAVALSFRLKGALSIGAAMAVVIVCKSRRRRGGVVGLVALFAILAVGLFAFEGNVISRQLSVYSAASSDATARGLLYKAGAHIAVSNFPFGVGFGRFASFTSTNPYSVVYDEYGLSGVWGLSRAQPQFISDTSWPSVLGETGVAGLASFLGGLVALGYAAYARFRRGAFDREPVALALLCSIAVLLVDSLGAPSLFDWFAATTVALLAGSALSSWGAGARDEPSPVAEAARLPTGTRGAWRKHRKYERSAWRR